MITILIYIIFARVVLSFFGPKLLPENNKIVSVIHDITDPILKPFRRFQLGGSAMAIDFSPILAIFALNIVQFLIVKIFS